MFRHVVILRMDGFGEERLSALSDIAADAAGCPRSWPPHIAVGAYETDDPRRKLHHSHLRIHFSDQPELHFHALGVLPAADGTFIVSALPDASAGLLNFFSDLDAIWQGLSESAERSRLLHCPLVRCTAAQLPDVIAHLSAAFVPFHCGTSAVQVWENPKNCFPGLDLK